MGLNEALLMLAEEAARITNEVKGEDVTVEFSFCRTGVICFIRGLDQTTGERFGYQRMVSEESLKRAEDPNYLRLVLENMATDANELILGKGDVLRGQEAQIYENDETGEHQFSVCLKSDPENWLDSFPTYSEAFYYVTQHGLVYNGTKDYYPMSEGDSE